MSTFGGLMPEFPDIRVDYFRQIPNLRPPLACFLSHVHSDHLAGLENLKSPFVYCSAATKVLLLRLERYPHRLNFALGVLESRKQQYKHLKNLLKPIPLETPTLIELEPGNDIQVTLFNANHCIGAVMFLIEGNGLAVLYTGDIRSEPWWVNSMTRNPFLIEYASGLKSLDCMYLDTSNIDPIPFPTKADGLKELLEKVAKYPPNTTFHFTAWTFGYEEVWMALSHALHSQVHVDNYKLRLYRSLRGDSCRENEGSVPPVSYEGPVLVGYKCGNNHQAGCLTGDRNVRIHSCDKGMRCSSMNKNTVWIRPIITRTTNGSEIGEIGVAGGADDLIQKPELELDSNYAIDQFLSLFASTDDLTIGEIRRMLLVGLRSLGKAISLDDMGFYREADELSLTDLTKAFARSVIQKRSAKLSGNLTALVDEGVQGLPKVITFPYSRHSSYAELCHFVRTFNPKDIYPCTVDELNWHEGISMKALFGAECSAAIFRHDSEMQELHAASQDHSDDQQSQTTQSTQDSLAMPPLSSPVQRVVESPKSKMESVPKKTSDMLGAFVPKGKELSVAQLERIPTSTPPREIVAISPGSESQNLQRREIMDGYNESRAKRARLEYHHDSESPKFSRHPTNPSPPRVDKRDYENVSGEASLDVESHLQSDAMSQRSNSNRSDSAPDVRSLETTSLVATTASDAVLSGQDEEEEEFGLPTYWDDVDEVTRCHNCGHEAWTSSGPCTGCEGGQTLEPGSEYYLDTSRYAVGDYLDDQSSAYDSQDSARTDEEYEINSFIDDDNLLGTTANEGDSSSSDSETDYKERFTSLAAAYNVLLEKHDDLMDEHETFKKDILGSDFDNENDSYNSEVDEDGMVLVNVDVPDPTVIDVIISHAQDQSQASEISEDRVRNRIEAYEAAEGREGQSWHNISLVSTGDNHTHLETEL